MALIQHKDYIINIERPEVHAFADLANAQNLGMLFLGTKNYLFNLTVYDFEATFSSHYFGDQTYFKQTNTYYNKMIEGKTIAQAIVDVLTDSNADIRALEKMLVASMGQRGENMENLPIGGEYIDINQCEKFVVKKMWIGGGTISYKYPEDKTQKQIPIIKAADAKFLKTFYQDRMKR